MCAKSKSSPVFARLFTGECRGILLHPLPETAAQARAQRHGRFSIAIAQTVSRFGRLPPTLGTAAIHQVELPLIFLEAGSLDAQQADLSSGVPVGVQQG